MVWRHQRTMGLAIRVSTLFLAVWVSSGCSDDSSGAGGRDGGLDGRRDVSVPDGRADSAFPWDGAAVDAYRDGGPDAAPGRCGAFDLCVDPVLGDDSGDGSEAAPFRTLSRAMAAAAEGARIGVRPGTLNQANGENFPIRFRRNVAVVGIEAPESRPVIEGGDPAMVLADGAVLEGVEIRPRGVGVSCPEDAAVQLSGVVFVVTRKSAVEVAGANAEVASTGSWYVAAQGRTSAIVCTGQGSRLTSRGGAYDGPFETAVSLRNCVASLESEYFQVDGVGLEVGADASAVVRGSSFTGGRVGIRVLEGAAGLDLGTTADPGGNVLGQSSDADLCLESSLTVPAVGNQWDHDPPSTAQACRAGVDVGLPGGGSIQL